MDGPLDRQSSICALRSQRIIESVALMNSFPRVATVQAGELMIGLALSILDIAGTTVRIDLRLQSDTVELWCGTRVVGVFLREHLLEWLNDPIDPLNNRSVSWNSASGGLILEIGILFIAYPLARHDLDLIKAHISPGGRLSHSPEQLSPGGEDVAD
jgi:hypothetical protein